MEGDGGKSSKTKYIKACLIACIHRSKITHQFPENKHVRQIDPFLVMSVIINYTLLC